MSSNPSIITLKNVGKTYQLAQQQVRALKDVSLEVRRGQVVSVTGRSGSGKSTLLHVTGTLDQPTGGQVILDGKDVSKINDQMASHFRNRTVGFVFQMNNLLPEFSALENVMMPGLVAGGNKQAVGQRAASLLNQVELGHRLDHRPAELSGGEQRVAIARALLMEPLFYWRMSQRGILIKKVLKL